MGHRSTDPVDWHIGPVAVAGPVASFFTAGVFWSIERHCRTAAEC
jgi:hypothetical protein